MSEAEQQAKPSKAAYEPPAGAETSATWTGGATPLEYTASARWIVLHKKEKPAAEIFSVAYVATDGDERRPLTFVFNGGPGASSAYLHLGAVGPRRVAFPPDGSLPEMPPRLVQNEASWLAFTDLVFVDPVGTGFSRVIENDQDKGKESPAGGDKQDDAVDPKEFFGQKRDLESLCEFMGRWLSTSGRWGAPVFVAGESYGGYRVGRLVRMLQESSGIGLNGAILISPALEISTLNPTDYDVLGWVDTLPTMALAAVHHGRSRAFTAETPVEDVLREAEAFATGDFASFLVRGAAAAKGDRDRVLARLADLVGLPVDLVGTRRGTASDRHLRARAPAGRAQGARAVRHHRHDDRPVPRPRRVRRPRPDALGHQPRVHDGGQPGAPLRDRRPDRPRVHAAELRGEHGVEGRRRAARASCRWRGRPTTSATGCRSTPT